MRLAYFLEYPLSSQGGVSVLVSALIEELAREFEVVLVSPDSDDEIHSCPLGKQIRHHIHWPSPPAPPHAEYLQEAHRLVEQIAGLQVEICHFHCGGVFGWGNRWPGCALPVLLKRKGIPSVWTNHLVVGLLNGYCGPAKPLWFKLAMLPLAWLGKIQQISAVEREICVSNHDVRKMRRWYFPFRKKVSRLYHSRLRASVSLDAPPISASRSRIILSVGHIAFRKGQHVLAWAFARIASDYPDWELLMAGEILEADCADQIRALALANCLGNRIHLLGARDDAADLMKSAMIFVQPSLQEALGLALQEALWLGCACIGTDVGGIPELIEDGENGLLVPSDDVVAFASALERLIQNEQLRRSLGDMGPGSVLKRGMTKSAMIESHLKLYRRALGEGI